MIDLKKITVIGGDKRLRVAAEILSNSFNVDTLALYPDDGGDIKNSDVLLLPVPSTRDKKTVFAPLCDHTVLLSEIAEQTSGDQLILSCGYTFQDRKCIDYGALDSYSLLNAVPTAEGAIKLAIEHTPFTLWKSRVLVIGFGRVGKILSERLKAFGCHVTVSARKTSDFALIDVFGMEYINTERLTEAPLDFDIIFNTVDKKVIDTAGLERCKAKLIIDLSSLGGLDYSAAESMGITAFKAPGLPGVTAPETAGKILARTVTELINSNL